MSTSATCPTCLEQILPGDRFCTQCGAEVLAAQGNADTARISAERLRGEARSDGLLETIHRATQGDYEILRQIGSGGMARVFLAHDIALDRKVAIKVLLPGLATTPGTVERFKREARTAASLSHPHIIPIYVVREQNELLYFVMQFVEGRGLDGIVGDVGKLPIDVVVAVLSQVSGALHYAHRQGVIHRDVKPGNVLIDNEGWAVVTDFGIAKVREAVGLTLTGSTIGTPAYMSPEQCSASPITGASDQYSLGVVGYEMLTGAPPFSEGTVTDIMRSHVERDPPALADLRPDCPPEISAVLSRMLAKTPNDRFPSLGAVAQSLGAPPVSGGGRVRSAMIEMARSGGYPQPDSVPPRRPDQAAERHSTTEVVHPAPPKKSSARSGERGRRMMPLLAGVAVLAVSGIVWGVNQFTRVNAAPPRGGVAQNDSVRQVPIIPLAVLGPESLLVGQTDRLRVMGGAIAENDPVNWVSAYPNLLDVDSAGRIEGRAVGLARVWLHRGTDSIAHQLRIVAPAAATPVTAPPPVTPTQTSPPVVDLAFSPVSPRIEAGQTIAILLLARDERGGELAPDRVQWLTADPEIATVSFSGVVTGRRPGTTILRVVADGVEAETTVTVMPVSVARVTIDRPSVTLNVGDAVSLSAAPQSAAGETLSERRASWTSADPDVVTVDPNGVVTARRAGRTRVQVAVEGATAFTDVTVTAPPPATETDPAPVDPEPNIRAVIDRYAQAIESENLAALRTVYPDMPEQRWRTFFESVTDLQIETEVLEVSVVGDRALVRVRQVLVFRSTRRDHQESEFVATIVRGPDGWLIARIN